MFHADFDEVLRTGKFGPFELGGSCAEAGRLLGNVGYWDWGYREDGVYTGWYSVGDFEILCDGTTEQSMTINKILLIPGQTHEGLFYGEGIITLSGCGIFFEQTENKALRELERFAPTLVDEFCTYAVYRLTKYALARFSRPDDSGEGVFSDFAITVRDYQARGASL